jgi:hypothetical protein
MVHTIDTTAPSGDIFLPLEKYSYTYFVFPKSGAESSLEVDRQSI